MSQRTSGAGERPAKTGGSTLYKKDFWRKENLIYSSPHLRMEKIGDLVNKIAQGKDCALLDVGCGPATLQTLLAPNVHYYGMDIAIQKPAPNLIEADLIESPIEFGDMRFDIVVAQGFFEYVGKHQSQKFAEIAKILAAGGTFVASYVNFDHRQREVYQLYSNVQPFKDFRASLAQHFEIRRCYPTSYNWHHWEPGRKIVRAVNMRINANIPGIAPVLGVQYLFICSARRALHPGF